MEKYENINLVDTTIGAIEKKSAKFYFALTAALALAALGGYSAIATATRGVGLWSVDNQVSWGVAIVNFVFWIGVGHAGTLISAILMIFEQDWRRAINRIAETATVVAILCAALFPLIHTGRPWFAAYWLIPYPNDMGLWVNFKSPLVWDFFAIGAYFLVSIMFWHIGMIPDLAILKRRTKSRFLRKIYAVASGGWRGERRQWRLHKRTMLVLATIATPLVVSVHSIVSFDFSVALVPGWNSAAFPPYFVAGAIHSGCAFVVALAVSIRYSSNFENYIQKRHIENLNKIIIFTALLLAFFQAMDFVAIFAGGGGEWEVYASRFNTGYAWALAATLVSVVAAPQLYWIKRVRRSFAASFALSIIIFVGMWFERYLIVVPALESKFLTSSAGAYLPNIWEIALTLGGAGIFATLYMIILKIVPAVSIYENQE